MDGDVEWPPPEARVSSALWRAEGQLERGEYVAAALSLEEIIGLAPAGDRGLVRGLYHLAAAGYRAAQGDRWRALRQLARAERRLAPFRPVHREVEVAALLEVVRAAVEP
jgi:hypothetical protein